MKMRATIKYKEVGKPNMGKTIYIGYDITKSFIIDFFGLNLPDVESYEIEIENER